MSNYTAPWNLPLASEKPAKTPAFPSRGHDRLNGPEDKANASSSTSKPIRTMSSGSLMNDEPLETINEESHGTPLRPDVAPFFPTSVLIAAYDEARGKGIKLHRENDAGSIISPYYPPPVGSFLPPDTPPMPSTTPPPAPRPRHVTPSKTVAPSSALPNNSSFMSACYGPEDIWATPKKSYADAFGSLVSFKGLRKLYIVLTQFSSSPLMRVLKNPSTSCLIVVCPPPSLGAFLPASLSDLLNPTTTCSGPLEFLVAICQSPRALVTCSLV